MGVGLRLKKILRGRKITIKQLSEVSGVPLNTLYSITKRDSDRIDRVTLSRISNALNIPEYVLLCGEEDGQYISFGIDTSPEVLKNLPGATLRDDGSLYIKPGSEAEEKLFELIGVTKQQHSVERLTLAFYKLNSSGQQEAVKRVEELTEIPKYQRTENQPEATQEDAEDT